ncbi:MAG: hypothetical protein ACI4C1_05625 [Lachnospiraceae bacterium]
MKLRLKHSLVCLLAVVLVTCMLSGCVRTTSTENYSTTVVAKLGSKNIYLDEAAYMARAVQYSYESVFGSSSGFWDYDYTGNGETMEAMVKESVMQQIYQTKVLVAYAEKNNIELNEEQKELVRTTVAGILEDEVYANAVGANEDLLISIYTENALANVVYLKLTEDTDTSIDEAEYLHKAYDYIKVTADEDEETDEESVVSDILAAMESGEKIADIVSSYDDTAYKVSNSSNSFMESDDVSYGEYAWTLAENECGSVYIDGEGWYVLKCTSDNDEEAAQSAIDSEIQSRKDKNFDEKYAAIKAEADKFSVDEEIWALISFDEAVYVEETDTENESGDETASVEDTSDESAAEDTSVEDTETAGE